MAAAETPAARKPAARKPSRSGNPATRAAAKQDAELSEIEQAQQAQLRKLELEKAAEEALALVKYEDDGLAVLPASKGAIKEYQFRFRIDGSEKIWVLPNLNYLDLDLAQQLQTLSQADAMRAIFDKYIPGILSEIDQEQLMSLAGAWRNHSSKVGTKVDLGES